MSIVLIDIMLLIPLIYADSNRYIRRRFLKFLSLKIDGPYPSIETPLKQLLLGCNISSLVDKHTIKALLQ